MSQPFSTAQQPRDDVLAVFVHEFGVVLFFDFSMFRWALGLFGAFQQRIIITVTIGYEGTTCYFNDCNPRLEKTR